MSIEIIKGNFNIEELKGTSEIQSLVETEVYLNTNKEDIENIIWVEGRVEILNTMIIKDKVLVSGAVKYNILYKSIEEEENIYVVEASKDFNEEILIQGIKEGMEANVEANIEFIEHELEENKIQLSSVVNIKSEVEEIKTLEIIEDLEGRQDLEVLRETINYQEVYGRETSFADIGETIKIEDNKAEIEKVIKFYVEGKEIESVVSDDRIIVSGEAIVTMIYLGDNDIYSVKERLPFNHFIEMPGLEEGSKGEVELEVVEAVYEVLEDDLEEMRLIDVSIKIKATGKAYDDTSKDLIVDAYSTKENILLEKEEMNIPERIKDIDHEEELDFDIKINAIDILDINCSHNTLDKRYIDGEIIIEGVLNVDVYYIDRIGRGISSYKDHFPYKSNIPYESDSTNFSIDINSKLGDTEYTLRRDSLSLKNNINYEIRLNKDRKFSGIKSIETTGDMIDKSHMPSITIYIVQKGDILWDVARRYNTTTDEILRSNNLEPNYELKVGDKIIIEKNVDLDLQ